MYIHSESALARPLASPVPIVDIRLSLSATDLASLWANSTFEQALLIDHTDF